MVNKKTRPEYECVMICDIYRIYSTRGEYSYTGETCASPATSQFQKNTVKSFTQGKEVAKLQQKSWLKTDAQLTNRNQPNRRPLDN